MSKKPASKPSPKPAASKLGRGLSALMADIALPEVEAPEAEDVTVRTPAEKSSTAPAAKADKSVGIPELYVDRIERNPDQPRKVFDKDKLAELTKSIADKGVLQPILVRPLPARYGANGESIKNRYQIVAGERRWLAALTAGLIFIPALVRHLSDQEVLEIGVVENVQRADLTPMEEADAYQALIKQFGRKQSEIADAIGKSRSHVANCLRLLTLPKLAQEYLQDGLITAGHARAILSAPDPQALAEAIVNDGLSVRASEKWAAMMARAAKAVRPEENSDANTAFIEKKLSQHIGLKVNIKHKNPGGSVTIKYKTMDQLDDLVKRLRQS